MFEIVILCNGALFAAVGTSKKKLQEFRKEFVGGQDHTWRLRDNTGWCDGSENSHMVAEFNYPPHAKVIW